MHIIKFNSQINTNKKAYTFNYVNMNFPWYNIIFCLQSEFSACIIRCIFLFIQKM